jgi:hypothetical protein
MGQLVTIDELKEGLGLSWYFTEFNSHKRPVFPNSAFLYSVAINSKILQRYPGEDNYSLKHEIRKWVTRNCSDIVVIELLQKEYQSYYSWGSQRHSDHQNISWGYHVFHFELEAEAVMFKLTFSEHTSEVLPYDPENVPCIIQSAIKDLKIATDKLEAATKKVVEEKGEKAWTLEQATALYKNELRNWNGEGKLKFLSDEHEYEEDPIELERLKAIREFEQAKSHHDSIIDIHSTFTPKSRY